MHFSETTITIASDIYEGKVDRLVLLLECLQKDSALTTDTWGLLNAQYESECDYGIEWFSERTFFIACVVLVVAGEL